MEVTRTEQDMLQYGGGRSEMGENLKIYVLFPNAAVTLVQNGGQDSILQYSTTADNGGQDDVLLSADTVHDGGADSV